MKIYVDSSNLNANVLFANGSATVGPNPESPVHSHTCMLVSIKKYTAQYKQLCAEPPEVPASMHMVGLPSEHADQCCDRSQLH